MAPGQIRVNIFGTEYSLRSDDNENYIKEIARYLDQKMREVDKNNSIKSSSKISVLAALTHMVGQIIAVIIVVRTTSLIYYLPYMIIISVPTGLLTGYLAKKIISNFSEKIMNYK